MTDALFAPRAEMFRFSVTQSLTAIACLSCLYVFGVQSTLHMATASVTFVFCSLGNLSSPESEEV